MAAELAASTSATATVSSAMVKGTDAISRLAEAAENQAFQRQMFVPAASVNPLSVVNHAPATATASAATGVGAGDEEEEALNPVERIVAQGQGKGNHLKRNYEEIDIDAGEETELVETVKVVQKQIPDAVFGGLASKVQKVA